MTIASKQKLKMICGFIVLLFLGTTMAWSVFLVPIESTFGWSRSQTSLAATICTMCFSVGSILTGILSKKFSFSTILKIAGGLLFGGFFIASLLQKGNSILLLYLSYSVLVGTSAGMGYNCVLSSVPMWMSDKPAVANGILLMGYALSTALFAPVINTLLTVTNSVSFVFRTLALVCGIGVLVFSFFVRIPTIDEMKELPQRDRNAGKNDHSVITGDMVKMPLFWVLYLISILLPAIGLAINNHNSPILTEIGSNAAFAATVVSICAIVNGLSRFVFGFIFEKLGSKNAMVVVSTIGVIAMGVITLGYSTGSLYIYILGACLVMVSFGFAATSWPSIMRDLFGHRTFSLNYSVLCTDTFFNAWMASIVGLMQTSSGSYLSPLIMLLVVAVVNLVVAMLYVVLYNKEMKKREEA